MKILAVASWSDRSEAALFIGLHRAGVDVEVMCEPDSAGYGRYAAAGVPVTALPIRRRVDLAAIRRIRLRLREGGHDILHLLSRRTVRNGLVAAWGLDVRVVAYRGVSGTKLGDPSNWITYLHPRVDRIVCVSERVRRDLVERRLLGLRIDPRRVVTIYKGVDVGWFDRPPADLAALDIPPDAFVVGFLGNLRPGMRKGIDLLVDSARALDPALGVHFLLVGRGTDGPDVAGRIEAGGAAGRFRAVGYREDGPGLMAACDAMALPSPSEGLGRAVLESMACGTPPILTPTGAAELVEDGVSGIVVPHDDPAAIARAVTRLARDPVAALRMGEAARERIRQSFSIDDMVRQTRQLYEALLAPATGDRRQGAPP